MSITSEDSHVWLRPTLHPGGLHVGPAIPPSGLRGRSGTGFSGLRDFSASIGRNGWEHRVRSGVFAIQ